MGKKQSIQDQRVALFDRAFTKEHYAVAKWLSEVKFSPAVFGVDQADVWRKVEKLCELYEDALTAERVRNAKLERKLRALTAANKADAPVKQEVPASPEIPAVQKVDVPAASDAVHKPEISEAAMAAPSGQESDKKEIGQEEKILDDLLKEFGPNKGGKPNG